MMIDAGFLTPSIMQGQDWKGFELALVRILSHCGWNNIQYVGGSGDKGADILAVRKNPKTGKDESYLFQSKSVHANGYVGLPAITQSLMGQATYHAQIVVVATNGDFTKSVLAKQKTLINEGYDLRLWNGSFIYSLWDKSEEYSFSKREIRPYQKKIINKVLSAYTNGKKKAFFVVATGLGKTVIATTIANELFFYGVRKILVLCHSIDLALQLQQSSWPQLSKNIPTRTFMDGEVPIPIEGINFGLYQTLFGCLGGISPNEFDLIIVDEAHHALANAFSSCIEYLQPKFLVGMTATPWRGDGTSVESVFGEALESVSLVDGMRMGFLAKVDYRLMCDNINWDEIPKLAKKHLSIKDLNKRLFLPQRDDAVIKQIQKTMEITSNPRIAIFSPSVIHAESFAKKLCSAGIMCVNLSVKDKVARRERLLSFSSGRITAVTAVDVLNEGIDVPDVNILVFLRATHSRRIFIQQLGRGLRLSKDKSKVIVLDFVTDIRRIAAVQDIDNEARTGKAKDGIETVFLRDGIVSFSDKKAGPFIQAWLADVASLQDTEDAEKLTFPNIEETCL